MRVTSSFGSRKGVSGMLRSKWLFLGIVAVLPVGPVHAQTPYRVKDLNPAVRPGVVSDPRFLTAVGDVLFFAATDETNGSELWRSDGTSAGTRLVKDIVQGPVSSNLGPLTSAGGFLFFAAQDRHQLWRSDGPAAGTVRLGSFSLVRDVIDVGGTVFFSADGKLWKSDGTPAGTVMVKDLGFSETPRSLTRVGDRLFFAAGDGSNGFKLWTSDGTEAGTVLVKDVYPTGLIDVEGTLFF